MSLMITNTESSSEHQQYENYDTIGSKIIRALEIIRVKKLISNAVLCNIYLLNRDL